MEKTEEVETHEETVEKVKVKEETLEEAYFYPSYRLLREKPERLDEKEIERMRVEIEEKLQEFLRLITEETLQLSEFLIEEEKLIRELCKLLRPILKRLSISFNIPVKVIQLQTAPKQIILNEQGHLIIVYGKDRVDSKLLEEYPPDIVMAVFWNILPELGKSIKLYRKKISTRVNFFEKIKKELKNLFKAFSTKEKKVEPDVEVVAEDEEIRTALVAEG